MKLLYKRMLKNTSGEEIRKEGIKRSGIREEIKSLIIDFTT